MQDVEIVNITLEEGYLLLDIATLVQSGGNIYYP